MRFERDGILGHFDVRVHVAEIVEGLLEILRSVDHQFQPAQR